MLTSELIKNRFNFFSENYTTEYENYAAGRPLASNLGKYLPFAAAPLALAAAPALVNVYLRVGTIAIINSRTTSSLLGMTNAVLDRSFNIKTGFPSMDLFSFGAEWATNKLYNLSDRINSMSFSSHKDDNFRFYEHSSIDMESDNLLGNYFGGDNPFSSGGSN